MQKELYKLEDIIDVNQFQQVQNDISRATDMAVVTVDYKGVPFTAHSYSSAHCQAVRSDDKYRDLCQKCDSRGGLEAARIQKPYIYICHRGLVDLAVPIIANGQYIGAIMAGQVRLSDESNAGSLERIVSGKTSVAEVALEERLSTLYEGLPVMTLEKVEAIAAMLSHIARYNVESAIMKSVDPGVVSKTQSGKQVVQSEHTPLSDELLQTHFNVDFLKPALVFLEQHTGDHVYAEEMATLCNVSLSYFSKSFNKVTGMSFSAYQNKLKIQRAEDLLKESQLGVSQIADSLAYDNSSYFIKLFKRQTGVTPTQYRKSYHLKKVLDHQNSMK